MKQKDQISAMSQKQPSIKFIIPYFGQWPFWMRFFLKTCAYNPTIEWLIFTDCGIPEGAPSNIEFVELSYEQYCQLVSHRLEIDFSPPNAYKLCDIKPALGYIHEEHLVGYDFWAFGDIDVIYGDLRAYFTTDRLTKKDLFSTHSRRVSGHLCILRNTKEMREAFKLIPEWQTRFSDPQHLALDEGAFSRLFIGHKNWPYWLRRFAEQFNRRKRRSEFIEAHSTFTLLPNNTKVTPSKWVWRNGMLSNSEQPNERLPYFHFLIWKNNVWKNVAPESLVEHQKLHLESCWEISEKGWRSGNTIARTLLNGDAPKVSVIVPCYNYAQYVGDAINSILAQEYPNFELIVVDDGSTDNSAEVIQEVLKERGNASAVKLVQQENQGVSAALNSGLLHASGKYVATFDADDLMPQGRLALQVAHLEANPEVGCVGGLAIRTDAEGNRLPKKLKHTTVRRFGFDAALKHALVVGGGMAMYRREAIDKAGGYDPEIRIQDFQMTLKIAQAGYFIDVLPHVVTYYRKHDHSLSKNYKAELRYGLQVIDQFRNHPGYEMARMRLIAKVLRMAVIYDKQYAWALLRQVPLKQWDRVMFKRVRQLLFKKAQPAPVETLR